MSSASNWWQLSPMYGGGTVVSTDTSSTAAAAFGNGPGRYIFTAITSNAYIRLGTSSGMSAAVGTTGNFDICVPAGSSMVVWISPAYTHYRIIADAAGVVVLGKVGN